MCEHVGWIWSSSVRTHTERSVSGHAGPLCLTFVVCNWTVSTAHNCALSMSKLVSRYACYLSSWLFMAFADGSVKPVSMVKRGNAQPCHARNREAALHRR